MNIARFQLVEKVLHYCQDPPEIRCAARVPDATDELFKGHFPGMPLLPGNLMVEVMAQSSGMLVLRRSGGRKISMLAGVDRARFKIPVEPGSELICRSRLTYENPLISVYRAELACEEKLVASAEIRLSQSAPPNEQIREYMNGLARTIGLFTAESDATASVAESRDD